jgi:cytochrome c oxidase assembly factor CtaG
MTALGQPFNWHLDIFWTLAIPALVVAYLLATRQEGSRPTRRQRLFFALGVVALLVAFMWPLDDLAAHWSLLALVLQRLLLTLAVPPLLVTGTPRPIIVRLTRPAAVDTVLRLVVKPVPAVAIVTVVAVGTLTTGLVSLAADSGVARVVIQIVVLLSGFVLWAPVLTELPGRQPLSAIGRGGYLIVQSIVPSFLSVVWIFARRPLYAPYDHQSRVLGMSPVLDQQLAGFLAKLSTIAVLWTVAFTLLTRSQRVAAGADDDPEPLIWSDVEREIERAERADRRDQRARRPHAATPPDAPPSAPST